LGTLEDSPLHSELRSLPLLAVRLDDPELLCPVLFSFHQGRGQTSLFYFFNFRPFSPISPGRPTLLFFPSLYTHRLFSENRALVPQSTPRLRGSSIPLSLLESASRFRIPMATSPFSVFRFLWARATRRKRLCSLHSFRPTSRLSSPPTLTKRFWRLARFFSP